MADTWEEPVVRQLLRSSGDSNPVAAIEDYAERRRLEAGQVTLPIDAGVIASVLGIKCRTTRLDFSGRIYADESGQLVMDLSTDEPEPRRRFTCAHEIMHTAFPGFKEEARYRIDHTTGSNRRAARSEEEYLCDLGASFLLMPTALVAASYSIAEGLRAIERLHDDAHVSLEAAGNRLASLADGPAAFLVLQVMNKPADRRASNRGLDVKPELRVRYAATSRWLSAFVPPFKGVEADSVFGRARSTAGIVRGTGSLPAGAGGKRTFRLEAKCYPIGAGEAGLDRVLATAVAVA